MSAFETAFIELVGLEGNYSNDENDSGNWTGGAINKGELKGTMYGISAASYPTLDIVSLSLDKAKAIYFTDFWNKLRCSSLPDVVAIALFKEGVNLGVSGASRAFQKSLKVSPDGVLGQITIGIATSNPPKQVLENFLGECAWEYTQMSKFSLYGKGWLNRVIKTAVEAQLSAAEKDGLKA